jgi:hypothetical protein
MISLSSLSPSVRLWWCWFPIQGLPHASGVMCFGVPCGDRRLPVLRPEVDAFEQGSQGLVELIGRMILGQFVSRRAYATKVADVFVVRIDLFDWRPARIDWRPARIPESL